MVKLMDKKIITILHKLFLLNWPYGTLVGLNIHMHYSDLTMCMLRVSGGIFQSSTVKETSLVTSQVRLLCKI